MIKKILIIIIILMGSINLNSGIYAQGGFPFRPELGQVGKYADDIRVDNEGNIYISNKGGEVYKYSPSGENLFKYDFKVNLHAILLDKEGHLYLLIKKRDLSNDYYYIARCEKDKIIHQYRLELQKADANIAKADMDDNKNIYVLESGEREVKKFNSEGELVDSFADNVYEFTADSKGNVYLVLGPWSEERKIVKVDQSKKYLNLCNVKGEAFGLCDIAVNSSGELYVCGLPYGIKKFNGRKWLVLPTAGSYFSVESYPSRIVVDRRGRVYTLSRGAFGAKIFKNEEEMVSEISFAP